MGRPQTATDDEILSAAKEVFARRGFDAFTLSEVASTVGLSRAAIILRFESTRALKHKLLAEMADQIVQGLDKLPNSPSGDNLLEVAAFIGGQAGSRDSSASYFASYASKVRDREFMKLERRRGEALRRAISRAMPEVSIDHASAVEAFNAHLAGCVVSWIGRDDDDARAYLVQRTKEWLRLARIPFSDARGSGSTAKTRSRTTRPDAGRSKSGRAGSARRPRR